MKKLIFIRFAIIAFALMTSLVSCSKEIKHPERIIAGFYESNNDSLITDAAFRTDCHVADISVNNVWKEPSETLYIWQSGICPEYDSASVSFESHKEEIRNIYRSHMTKSEARILIDSIENLMYYDSVAMIRAKLPYTKLPMEEKIYALGYEYNEVISLEKDIFSCRHRHGKEFAYVNGNHLNRHMIMYITVDGHDVIRYNEYYRIFDNPRLSDIVRYCESYENFNKPIR